MPFWAQSSRGSVPYHVNIPDIIGTGTISISDLAINLIVGSALSFVLAGYYMRFARTFSNRGQLARVLPFISLTTLLLITVVKSSLALSLGLVGALSIVRFRTPIKEPEELAYLFLAIGLGVGLGADQRIATVVAVLAILAIMLVPNCCQSATMGQIGTRENYCYGEPLLSSLTVRL